MSDDGMVSFFLVQDLLDVSFPVLLQHNTMPCDLTLHRIWCNMGIDALTVGWKIDCGLDVIRYNDAVTLARFRDDHYSNPTGLFNIAQSWTYGPGERPRLDEGELVEISAYATSFNNMTGEPGSDSPLHAYMALEFIGRTSTPALMGKRRVPLFVEGVKVEKSVQSWRVSPTWRGTQTYKPSVS